MTNLNNLVKDFNEYYKRVKLYGLISDCNDVYTKVQDCLNFLKRIDELSDTQIKFIEDTYKLIQI
jgi:hypothetical protein